jgi:hypothetical protein
MREASVSVVHAALPGPGAHIFSADSPHEILAPRYPPHAPTPTARASPHSVGWILNSQSVHVHSTAAHDVNKMVHGVVPPCSSALGVEDYVRMRHTRPLSSVIFNGSAYPAWSCTDPAESPLAFRKQQAWTQHNRASCAGAPFHNEVTISYGPCDIIGVFYYNGSSACSGEREHTSSGCRHPDLRPGALAEAAAGAAKRAALLWELVSKRQHEKGCTRRPCAPCAPADSPTCQRASPVPVVQFAPGCPCKEVCDMASSSDDLFRPAAYPPHPWWR